MKQKYFYTFLYLFLLCLLHSESGFSQKVNLQIYVNKKIRKRQKIIFDTSTIKNLVNKQLEELYNQNYLDARLDSLIYQGKRAKAYFTTQQNYFLKINIANYDSLNIIKSAYHTQNNYNLKKIILINSLCIKELQNSGFPFVNLEQSAKLKADTLLLKLNFTNLKYIPIYQINIKKLNFSSGLLARYLNLIPAKAFDLNQWQEAQKILSHSPYFKVLKSANFEHTDNGLDLFFYIQKKTNSSINGLVAFKGNDKKTQWMGNFDLSLINTFNQLEKLQINWQSLPNLQKKMKINIEKPYLLNSGFMLQFQSNYEQFDSSLLTLNTIGLLSYSINYNWNTFINLENFKSFQNLPEKISTNYYLKGIGLEYQNKIRNLRLKTKVSASFSNTDNIKRQKLGYTLNLTLNLRNWQFSTLNTLLIKDYAKIKAAEMSYLGGINSVIGYLPNSFIVQNYYHNRIEAEYRLNDEYKLISLSDILIYNNLSKKKQLAQGIGTGFKIRKKNTAIELLFAIAIQKKITNFPPANLNFKLINYF